MDKAGPLGQEILQLGQQQQDPRILLDGYLIDGINLVFAKDLQGGLDQLDRAIALFDRVPKHEAGRLSMDPRISCLTTSGFALWLMGYPERAVARMNEATRLANELDSPFTTAFARFHSGLLRLWNRDPQATLSEAGIVIDTADQFDLQIWRAAGLALRGAAKVALGQVDPGLEDLDGGIQLYIIRRSPPIFWLMLQYTHAGALLRAGRPADGLRVLEKALELLPPDIYDTLTSGYLVLKGDLLLSLASDDPAKRAEAEATYQLALRIATDANVRMYQLQAATRLARLHGDDSAEVLRLLSPILETFAPDSEYADLREARELLAAAR
jgi:tetratricopeptide (TPR) repeat protein